jgi:hypothetical protein
MDLFAEKFPKAVAPAVDKLIEQFTNREKVKIANMSQNALAQFHNSIENYIVTEFRLPGNGPLMQSCGLFAQLRELNSHQASYIILQAMQLRLQETAFLKLIK